MGFIDLLNSPSTPPPLQLAGFEDISFDPSTSDLSKLFNGPSVIPISNKESVVRFYKDISNYLPPFITATQFQTRYGPLTFYQAQAENEQVSMFGLSGLKKDFSANPDRIKERLDHGISSAWVAIPNMGRATNFIGALNEVVEDILLHPQCKEIEAWLNKPSPTVLEGFSTGAQLILHSIRNDAVLNIINKFDGLVLDSTFAVPTGFESITKRKIFEYMLKKHPDKAIVETEIGRAYLIASGRSGSRTEAEHRHATFSQVNELIDHGFYTYFDTYEKSGNIHKLNIPITVIAGEKDKFSCHDTQEKMADNIGALFISSKKGGHGPTNKRPKIKNKFHKIVLAMGDGSFTTYPEQYKTGKNSQATLELTA